MEVLSGRSIQIARVAGIRIGVEPSWFIVLFLIVYLLTGYYGDRFAQGTAFALAAISALLFFVSVLLHELGHAVVARRNDIGIAGIDLWMLGGVAKMQRDTDSAGVEFRVAAAGPLVTLLIGGTCFGAGVAIAGSDGALESTLFDSARSDQVLAVLGYLTFINGLLLVFNLIPAFPLDGGRIARAAIWWRTGDRAQATRLAALVGRGFAFLVMGAGVVFLAYGDIFNGIWFLFLGLFLGQAARQAQAQSALTNRIEGLRVADVMDSEPVVVPADLSLDRTWDEFFLRYGWAWFPVADPEGRFSGLIVREAVEGVPEHARPGRAAASVMAGDAGEAGRLHVGTDEPLEAVLGLDGLQRLGAVVAVDPDGGLRGVVTVDQVRRALRGDGLGRTW